LPGVQVLAQDYDVHGQFHVAIVPQHPLAVCPPCLQLTPKLRDVWRCTTADEPLGQRLITLILLRQFRCLTCEVVFTAPNEVGMHRPRLTQRFRERLEAEHQNVHHVAATCGEGPTTVRMAETESAAKQSAELIPTV